MGFTKIFEGMLGSTVWLEDSDTRVVWLTLLLRADRDGIVEGSIPGLAHQARVSLANCAAALQKFLAPDEFSRTKDHEGRRIREVPGGWEILNHALYRDKASPEEFRAKAAERQRRRRKLLSQKRDDVTLSNASSRGVALSNDIAEADTEAETDTKAEADLSDFERMSEYSEGENAHTHEPDKTTNAYSSPRGTPDRPASGDRPANGVVHGATDLISSIADRWAVAEFEGPEHFAEWFRVLYAKHPTKGQPGLAESGLHLHVLAGTLHRLEFERVYALHAASDAWRREKRRYVPKLSVLVQDKFWLFPPVEPEPEEKGEY